VEAILVFGLIQGWKSSYILLVVFFVLGVAVNLSKGAGHALGVLVGNAIVAVPMVISTCYFFPKVNLTPQSDDPKQPDAF
jgi:hypothetical protein